MAFIDEAGEAVGRYNDAMNKTATRGRHCGHVCHYCAQNATQIAPLVRDQCTGLFLFSSPVRSGKMLSEEWGFAELETCNLLRTGEYFHATKMGACHRRALFGGQDERSKNSGSAGDGSRDDGRGADDGRQEETPLQSEDDSGEGRQTAEGR